MKYMMGNRTAFTMIELIFVIVILGILASIAIPKLAATRDDAKASTAAANLRTCLSDAGEGYTASGAAGMAASLAEEACTQVIQDACFTVAATTTSSVTATRTGAQAWCIGVASTNAAYMLGTHSFGGSAVSY